MFKKIFGLIAGRATDIFISDGKWRLSSTVVNLVFLLFSSLASFGLFELIRYIIRIIGANTSSGLIVLYIFLLIPLIAIFLVFFIPSLISLAMQICELFASMMGLSSPSNYYKNSDFVNIIVSACAIAACVICALIYII